MQAPAFSPETSLCLRCVRRSGGCCRHHDIYVTPSDSQRIEAAIRAGDFFEYRNSGSPDYADQADDPVWSLRVFRPDGTRRVLKKGADGACIFLGPAGCILSLEARPLICRLHPHLYNDRGLMEGISPDCAVDLLCAGERLEDAIAGYSLEDALRWHKMLYEEILREEPNPCL